MRDVREFDKDFDDADVFIEAIRRNPNSQTDRSIYRLEVDLPVMKTANKEALLGIESMWTETCNVATTDRVARMLHKTNKAAEW